MADITLITFGGSLVTPQHDALMADAELTGNGTLYGCEVTGSQNTLHISHGVGVIYGREFEIAEHVRTVQSPQSGSLLGQVFIRLNLSAPEPISIEVETAQSLTALEDNADINTQTTHTTEMQLATFSIDTSGISNVRQTAPQITRVPDAIADLLSGIASTNASLTDLRTRTQVTNVTRSSDLNSYTSQGVYYFGVSYVPTHVPSGNTNGFLWVLAQGTMTKQIWLRTGTVGTNDTETYIRAGQSGTWSNWDRVLTRRGRKVEDLTISRLNSLTWTQASGVWYSSDITPETSFTRIESIAITNWGVLNGVIIPYIHGTKVALMSASGTFTNSSNLTIRIVGD